MPYVDDDTYQQLISVQDTIKCTNRRIELNEQMLLRINRQLQDIISRYGAIPNPLISRNMVEELRYMGEQQLAKVYGVNATKLHHNEMWKQFRNYFEIKRITQLCVSQIPDAMRYLERWVPVEKMVWK